ncbi:MAG: hypothetical protein R2856_39125 [Caldilineaceae bacterium]
MDRCLESMPPLYQVGPGQHEASCFLYDDRPVSTADDTQQVAAD